MDPVEGKVGTDTVAGAQEHEVVALLLAGYVVESSRPEFSLAPQIVYAQNN